jgi:hypothetical protein
MVTPVGSLELLTATLTVPEVLSLSETRISRVEVVFPQDMAVVLEELSTKETDPRAARAGNVSVNDNNIIRAPISGTNLALLFTASPYFYL